METTSVGAKRFHCAKVLQTEVFAVPDGWMMGIPVSKSHHLQRMEQLRFVSASRFYWFCCDFDVPCDCRQGPLPIASAKKHHTLLSAMPARVRHH